MARIGLILDDIFPDHFTGRGHPERPERLRRITETLTDRDFVDQCHRLTLKPLDPIALTRTHTDAYDQRLIHACENRHPHIDTPDSAICPRNYELALLSARSARLTHRAGVEREGMLVTLANTLHQQTKTPDPLSPYIYSILVPRPPK